MGEQNTQSLARTNGTPSAAIVERVVVAGDLAELPPQQRAEYYRRVCESLGLNPFTRPFEYIKLNGKLTLYARKDATDQLRSLRKVSLEIASRETVGGLYVVTARATLPDGRTDEEIGAVSVAGLNGEALANAMMKASTKAKRRVTLSVCGLGWLDESEAESIPDARHVRVDVETGEIAEPAVPIAAALPEAPKAVIDAARDLYRQAREAGIPVEPPAAKDNGTLVTWAADVRHQLEVHRGTSAAAGDQDDVEAGHVSAEDAARRGAEEIGRILAEDDGGAPVDEADEFDRAFPAHTPAPLPGTPAWADTPLGKQVSALVDALTEARAKFQLPSDDASEADLQGWIASKKGLLKARGGQVPA